MYKESSEHLLLRIKELEDELKAVKQSFGAKSGLVKHLLRNAKGQTQEYLSVIDTDFTVVELNQNRLKQLTKKRNEIIGTKCYKAFYDLDKECKECTVKEVISSRKASRFLKSYDFDNAIKFEEKTVSPILNEEGVVERLVIESKDISGYYQLVDKVGQREEFFKNIFESAGDAFLIHDSNGNILDFGSKLPVLLGYSQEEFKKLSLIDIDDPRYSMKIDSRQEQMKDKDHLLFETELIRKSGVRIPVEVSATLIPLQGEKLFFVSLRNLEKRKKVEEDLKISEKRFRTLVENAPDLIMRFDKNYKHLFVNSATKTLLNIEPEEFIGKTHEELGFPEHMCKFWEKEMKKVFLSSKLKVVEFSIQIDGEDKYFDWQLIPEFDEEGQTETILAVARDITARKLNEKALEDAVKTKDKFFSIIAHDLKNPFNAMLPIIHILKENHLDMQREQLSEMIELINSSVKQEYNLLKNLLEWSRAQTGAIKLKPERIELRQLFESNLLLHRAVAENKNISIEVNDPESYNVLSDKYMLETVIRNLVSNALKFTETDGNIKIHITEDKNQILCSVQDNGIGISPENQQKLFRIDTNYTRLGTKDESGTGLGLILCKEFVEKNGGSITVQSEVAVGSTFTFSLPKAP
ncbi:PAS domain-containing protein [Marinifilum fragile]|uniref:PAS domain-containing protein n=1 Tax=Marinifilum fragile TaxID=570161 RepID=UPI0006D06309|nr:PAS domain-containing sensor histidine kinase [Marinifilum fragile]